MTDLVTVGASVVSGVLGGGGIVAIVNALAARRTTKVDAADRLSDGALRWVDEFQAQASEAQADAKDARKEAAKAQQAASNARTEAGEALAQMRTINAEATWLADQLQALRRAILAPDATIERLRAMVGPNTSNGTGR